MMVVHLCEKLGLLYCMSQLGTWVGGWVGGCQTPPPPGGGGHLSVCGYAKILGGWVPELTPPPPPVVKQNPEHHPAGFPGLAAGTRDIDCPGWMQRLNLRMVRCLVLLCIACRGLCRCWQDSCDSGAAIALEG